MSPELRFCPSLFTLLIFPDRDILTRMLVSVFHFCEEDPIAEIQQILKYVFRHIIRILVTSHKKMAQ